MAHNDTQLRISIKVSRGRDLRADGGVILHAERVRSSIRLPYLLLKKKGQSIEKTSSNKTDLYSSKRLESTNRGMEGKAEQVSFETSFELSNGGGLFRVG